MYKKKILMVCLGNICRSPLAEGLLKEKINPSDIYVDSAGTAAYHSGENPDKRSIAIASRNGIDISNQKARQIKLSDFDEFDIIYAMDKSNYNHLINMVKESKHKAKVKMILEELYPNEQMDVPDPYYGGEQGFEHVYQLLNEATKMIAKQLTTK